MRIYTLLDFDSIPFEILEVIWHELGRVKEYDGKRDKNGYYYVISICKPLLLVWGQTLAFDSYVRAQLPRIDNGLRYSSRWSLEQWVKVMKELGEHLKKDLKSIEYIRRESEQWYGKNAVIPYGRFLDMYYWEGHKKSHYE